MQGYRKGRPTTAPDLAMDVDALTLALVREYLVKRGYHAAAAALDVAKVEVKAIIFPCPRRQPRKYFSLV